MCIALLDIDLFKRDGVRVIDVLRGDASLRRDLAPVKLEAGDRVVLRTEMTELMGLHARKDVHLVDSLVLVKVYLLKVSKLVTKRKLQTNTLLREEVNNN